MINKNAHLPYCELPSEARALFTIFGLAASARFVAKPPRRASLDSLLNVVWDAERLTLNDLSDPNRMTILIEQYMVPPGKIGDRSSAVRQVVAA
jgi:hypothetical protein